MPDAKDLNESELLSLLFERPALYIGHRSVDRAECFISGYTAGRKFPPDDVYLGFSHWLRDRFEIRQNVGWTSIVKLIGSSEEGAFSVAKELWLEYLQTVSK